MVLLVDVQMIVNAKLVADELIFGTELIFFVSKDCSDPSL